MNAPIVRHENFMFRSVSTTEGEGNKPQKDDMQGRIDLMHGEGVPVANRRQGVSECGTTPEQASAEKGSGGYREEKAARRSKRWAYSLQVRTSAWFDD
jgi:hypothetical protein